MAHQGFSLLYFKLNLIFFSGSALHPNLKVSNTFFGILFFFNLCQSFMASKHIVSVGIILIKMVYERSLLQLTSELRNYRFCACSHMYSHAFTGSRPTCSLLTYAQTSEQIPQLLLFLSLTLTRHVFFFRPQVTSRRPLIGQILGVLFVREKKGGLINSPCMTSDRPLKSLVRQLMVSIYCPHRRPLSGDEDLLS